MNEKQSQHITQAEQSKAINAMSKRFSSTKNGSSKLVKDLTNLLDKKLISPEAALDEFNKVPGTNIGDMPINNLAVECLPCGIPALDKSFFLKKDEPELVIVAARPGVGKSLITFQIAEYVSRSSNVMVFSLEMDKKSSWRRLLAFKSGRSMSSIMDGTIPLSILESTQKEVRKQNFFIDDTSRLDVKTIRAMANHRHQHTPLSLVVVDYLQIISGENASGNRDAIIGEITSNLKALAKDLRCPVLVACQVNRAKENASRSIARDRKISYQLSDLRESGNIEQDADVIAFIDRECDKTSENFGFAELFIAKNRNGEGDRIPLRFSGSLCKFYSEGEDRL